MSTTITTPEPPCAAPDLDWAEEPDAASAPTGQASLPETQVGEPEANGIKTIVEWSCNEVGQRVKRTTTIATSHRPCRINQVVLDRRLASEGGRGVSFGRAAATGNAGGITRVDVPTRIAVTARAGDRFALRTMDLQIKKHVETTFRHKKQASTLKYRPRGNLCTQAPDSVGSARVSTTTQSGSSTPPYIPPRLRGANPPTAGQRGGYFGDVPSVRISELSEDATEGDLHELCQAFGLVSRTRLVRDKCTKESRGFGFVEFHRQADAQRAIDSLNGHGYANRILRAEWAQTSTK